MLSNHECTCKLGHKIPESVNSQLLWAGTRWLRFKAYYSFNKQLCHHSQNARRLKVLLIFRRGGLWRERSYFTRSLKGSNNTPQEMSLRQSLPSEGKQTIESVRRIKHVQLKRKEVHHTEAWFFFFFSVTVDGTNTLELIHVSENMLVTYVENYDGERITKMTEGLGKYCSLCRWAPTISTFKERGTDALW